MSGIQKKYLKYMCTLLILALVLSSICVWTYVRRNMTDVIVDKYEFMNEKMGIALDNLYRKTDAVTAEIILENDVQKSLKNKELQEVEKNALSKYFAYIDLNYVADYCYIDNKRNVYEKSYSQIGYSDFQSSGLREKMGDEYAKTQWIWTRDYLFYPQLGVKLCSMAGGGVQKIYMVFLREPSRRDRSGSDLFHLRDGFEIKMNFDRNVSCFIFVNAFMHDDFFD